jgi:N-acetylglucosaminyldiphosphoundecaprenol N-acetyl-beta-D-mannosaminyltransferase
METQNKTIPDQTKTRHCKYPSKIRLFGTSFDNITVNDFCDGIETFIQEKEKLYLVTVKDVSVTVLCLEDPVLQDFYNRSDLIVVDGRGLVYAAFLLYCGRQRVCKLFGGPGGYYAFLKRASTKHYRVYYFGATDETVKNAVANVKKRLPELIVCGSHHGYVNNNNIEEVLKDINRSKPDVIFIGISAKIRESIIMTYGDRFPKCVCFFIGGMIDVEAGLAKFAPRFLSHLGVEWLWRVIQEPRRLGPRYFYTMRKFLFYLFRDLLKSFLNGNGSEAHENS